MVPCLRFFMTIGGFELRTSYMQCSSLRDKCPYSEFLWPVFSSIRKEYVSLRIQYAFSPNAGKYGPENSEYGHFSRNGYVTH